MVDDTDDSEIKIVDFGLSKIIMPGETCKEPFGTFGYAAPEIFMDIAYDKSVDIWALGVISYALLGGRQPFQALNVKEIARKTIEEEADFSSKFWTTI